ncbi:hypothetical protein [Sporichthya sp.]|uniref:hypothetical protein n=1 Tax=Sporichthya sp. TaxID=65475 RepID=UPI00183586FF|nr:hypothetical protein [Sporichthya sp.]MBA3741818.1 hypothetical protein [Sporichthya sp.]
MAITGPPPNEVVTAVEDVVFGPSEDTSTTTEPQDYESTPISPTESDQSQPPGPGH